MALSWEVIDLISDSEDEISPSKAAVSTLQAFVPRKEKTTSANQFENKRDAPLASAPQRQPFANMAPKPHVSTTPRPHVNVASKPKADVAPKPQTNITPRPQANTAPRPQAHVVTPNAVNDWTNIRPNASISEILSHGLQDVARRAGLHPQQQSPGATAFGQRNGLDRNDTGHLQRQQKAPKVRESPRTQFFQYRPTPADPGKPRGVGGADERIHEERQRGFVEYHKKESERKGKIPTSQSILPGVDTSAGAVPAFKARDSTAAQGIIASSRLPGVDYQAPSWQKQSPPRQEPEAKRRKYGHREEADDAAGMVEARRLSAAAIRQESDSASHKQSPAEVDPRGIASHTLQPLNLDVNANTVLPSLHGVKSSRQAPVAATILQERGSTEESRRDDAESSFVASKPPAPKEYVRNKDEPILLDESSDSDSPDEIPAKPMRRRPDTRKPETIPPSATYQTTKSATSVTSKAGSTLTNVLQTTTLEQVDVNIVRSKQSLAQANQVPATQDGSNHGTPYSIEEDNLLAQLREAGTGWDEIIKHFSGRTRGSLQVRYSTKLKHRKSVPLKPQSSGVQKPAIRRAERSEEKRAVPRPDAETPTDYVAPSRRNLKVAPRNDGFVSWAEIRAMRSEKEENATENSATPVPAQEAFMQTPGLGLDFAYPASVSRILRARELGNTARRNWSSNSRLDVSDELQNHVLDTLGPRRYFHGASRDVTCVAWADNGNRFAAGAIAIDDERSMQYNRPNNLLLGDLEKNSLQELPEHHVPRPAVSDIRNVNSLRAMQETQDPRLFKTVAAVGFSEDSSKLYSAGSDGVVRMYDASSGGCLSSIKHEAEVALLTTNSNGLLASGSHRPDDSSISVFYGYNDRLETVARFGPSRADVESSLPIFPSALRWGAGIYSHLLLAGFASDSYDDDRLAAGEILLWDASADRKINLPTARNVFDVAWNPFPSPGSSLFAVAGARHGRHYRSSIQCFAPNQGRASRVLVWDCPAFDINDLVYCPHDDNLIAAGATDGKVYIWDKRGANRSQAPLHVLSHDQTKNVLDHDRDVEIADTGVRFLSWSATGNRLYSGSSDGTVKVWNPYRAPQDVHVKDVATFNSAVMSGAFSPDYRDLLIGEDAGQVNLLSVDREERSVRATKKFEYFPAPAPIVNDDKFAAARELLATGQVQIRPMGDLPVRQAVQGSEYKGPFLAPSDDFVAQLDTQYQLAMQKQRDLRTSLFGRQLDQETEKAMDEADRQVLMCKQAHEVAQQKWLDHKTLEPAALLLQKTFRDAQPTAIEGLADQLTKNCSLDCNYLSAAGDEDGEAPDNHRSERRIPGKLRSLHRVIDTADMTNAEIQEAGLTGKCSACRGPAPKSKRGLPICEQCSLARAGLTARCEKCAAPVRPNLDERINQTICERCNFYCFRCGGIAIVSPTCDTITCEPCGKQWEAGVLGYEVMGSHSSSRLVKNWSHEQDMESLDERMGRMFGEDEMERLAGGWN